MSDLSPIQLQKSLHGVDYPAHRDVLVRVARRNGADSAAFDRLEQIPDDTYTGPNAVSRGVFR